MMSHGPLSGQTLGGKYLLGELLGRGGFGAVYRAENQFLHRQQAVKVLLEEHFSDTKFRERFLREVRTLGVLDHPQIVHIDDLGMEGHLLYLVMPFISGGTLQDLLKARSGPLELEEVTRALEQMCTALSYAHAQGIVHLDLKPRNVLVHQDGRLLLSDFGLAHLLEQGAIGGGTSLRFGSPLYMAPEQFEGRPTPQSDIYALGVILYQLLVGQPPFEASTPAALMRQHLLEPPPRLSTARPNLPAEVEKVLAWALAKSPEQRYGNAGELLGDFNAALAGQVVSPMREVVPVLDDVTRPSQSPLAPLVPATHFTESDVASLAPASGQAVGPGSQTRRCTHCGTDTPLPMRFCGACGRPLDAPPWKVPSFPVPSTALSPGLAPVAGALPAKPRRVGWLRSPVALLVAFVLVLVVVGTTVLVALKPFSHTAPLVVPGTVTEFPVPTPGSQPTTLTVGPDGNLWFVESQANQIGRITPGGKIAEFAMPQGVPVDLGLIGTNITTGPDGNLWVVPQGVGLVRITPSGAVTGVPFQGDPQEEFCSTITTGPDGNLWCAGVYSILRIAVDGAITAFPVPESASPTTSITTGPDGNLWFIGGAYPLAKIGRITPRGTVTLFSLPQPRDAALMAITPGRDGNLWFTESSSSQIGRITPSGIITEFPLPEGSEPGDIAAGPDGNLWFTESRSDQIGRITPSGVIKEFPIPSSDSEPIGIAAGPDGNLWFTENQGNQIGRITP